jgi:hypothetical protein
VELVGGVGIREVQRLGDLGVGEVHCRQPHRVELLRRQHALGAGHDLVRQDRLDHPERSGRQVLLLFIGERHQVGPARPALSDSRAEVLGVRLRMTKGRPDGEDPEPRAGRPVPALEQPVEDPEALETVRLEPPHDADDDVAAVVLAVVELPGDPPLSGDLLDDRAQREPQLGPRPLVSVERPPDEGLDHRFIQHDPRNEMSAHLRTLHSRGRAAPCR